LGKQQSPSRRNYDAAKRLAARCVQDSQKHVKVLLV
jgi:hypothetical protein